MKNKLLVGILIVILLTVSFAVPVGITTDGKSSVDMETEEHAIVSQAKTVLFDESHIPASGYAHDEGLANLTADLESHGYSVENMTTWSESTILSADVIIVPIPTLLFSAEEVDTFEQFVAKGGGLFIIGDNPGGTTAYDLAMIFDIEPTFNYLQDHDDFVTNPYWIRWDRVSNFGDHPITTGVSSVTTYLGYGFRNYAPMTVPILMMDADTNSDDSTGVSTGGIAAIVATEYQSGLGRIVVTGDVDQFGAADINGNAINDYFDGDNDLLARNIIDWLANAPIPENIVVFDESHHPYMRIGAYGSLIDVVFDDTHNQMYDIDINNNYIYSYADDGAMYGDLAAILDTGFLDIHQMLTWDSGEIEDSEVFVLVNPSTVYDAGESEVILSAVRMGTGLLLIGEVGDFLGAGAAQIASLFGVEFYDGALSDADDYIDSPDRIRLDGSNLADHPSLNGVHEIGYFFGGGFKTVPDDAVAILSSDDDTSSGWSDEPPGSPSPRDVPCAITFQYGEGRVMMIADSNVFTNTPINPFMEYGSNSLFAVSALSWLGQAKGIGGFWYGAQTLRNQGYGTMAMRKFSASFLEGSDALVLPAPMDFYSASEKNIIEDYVSVQGNGLFMLCQDDARGDSVRDLATNYGIIFDSLGSHLEDTDDAAHPSADYIFTFDEHNIRTHAITEGVDGLLWWTGTGIVRYPENAEVILAMDDDVFSIWENGTAAADVALMVALETGNGRIVALGDPYFWSDSVLVSDIFSDKKTMALDQLNNSLIMLNSVDWLLGQGEGPLLPFELPWWAIPAIGVVAVVIILGAVGLRKRSGGKKTTSKSKSKTKKKKK